MNKAVLTLLACALAVGCQPTTTVKKSSSSSSSSSSGSGLIFPTATPTPTSTSSTNGSTTTTDQSCYAAGIGSQSIKYYTLKSIYGKGTTGWSSKSYSQQSIFTSDSRVNVRLIAKPSPGKGTFGSLFCQYEPVPYTKLQAKVGIKGYGSTGDYTDSIVLDSTVGGCSDVYEFTNLPSNYARFQLDISNVKWNYDCGGTKQYFQHSCPYHPVWDNDCWEMELQFSTDDTTDIPH